MSWGGEKVEKLMFSVHVVDLGVLAQGLAEAWQFGRVVLDFGVPLGAAMKVREG